MLFDYQILKMIVVILLNDEVGIDSHTLIDTSGLIQYKDDILPV